MRKSPNLEEIFNHQVRDEELLEVPLADRAFRFFALLAVIISLAIVGRIIGLSLARGEFYAQRAFANANDVTIQNPLRGIIFDRFGKPLVENESIFNIILIPSQLPKGEAEKNLFVSEVGGVLGLSPEEWPNILKDADLIFNRVLIAKVSDPQKIVALENLGYPAIQIENDYRRVYPGGPAFAHLLGYLGAVTKKDLADNQELSLTDDIGRAGLEGFYDKELRGVSGEMVQFRDAHGNLLGKKIVRQPKAGESLKTTIDGGLQEFFYEAMKRGLRNAGSPAGVGIALNPRDGSVLAMVSLPSFDNNAFSKIDSQTINSLLSDRSQPLFNRAIMGVYSPGSTIKPLVASAALKEDVIDTKREIFSAGFIEVPNPYNPSQPSRFVDWKPHGWVNFYSAIARSSNVYFYYLGGGFEDISGLGIERLKEYWQKFLLDKKTGIDLPGEQAGSLPDPDTKEKKTGQIWRLGDTYNVSIGQGDLLVTPIELINYIAAIANGGHLYQLRIKEGDPVELAYLDGLQEIFVEVEKGMLETVDKSYGTAYVLNDLPFQIAAKTGSAQTNNNTKLNALFVGYAPVPNPEIVLLILAEDAPHGGLTAVPIAKEVLMWYYSNRISNS